VQWVDSAGRSAIVQLVTAKQRRLFYYLRKSATRDVKALPQPFIDGLAAAYVAVGDPTASSVEQSINPSASGPWKIQALKIEGFGGVNIWNGSPFELATDCEGLLIEGPNGSGKSSLIAAMIWALTGERPPGSRKELARDGGTRFRHGGQPLGCMASCSIISARFSFFDDAGKCERGDCL
jgi:hypothetical protein